MRPNHFVLTGIGLALACTGSVQAQTALKFNDDAAKKTAIGVSADTIHLGYDSGITPVAVMCNQTLTAQALDADGAEASWFSVERTEADRVLLHSDYTSAPEARSGLLRLTAADGTTRDVPVVQSGNTAAASLKGDTRIVPTSASDNQHQGGQGVESSIDGDFSTLFHSPWSDTQFPVTLTYNFLVPQHIDYAVYYPRTDGNSNGNFGEVTVEYTTSDAPSDWKTLTEADFGQSSSTRRIDFGDNGIDKVRSVRFTINSGGNGFAACAEMEFYQVNTAYDAIMDKLFADGIYSTLKQGITENDINTCGNAYFRQLGLTLLNGGYTDWQRRFRIGTFECYETVSTLAARMKTSGYNPYENPTGIYFSKGKTVVLFVEGMADGLPVTLNVHDFSDITGGSDASYPLKNGINVITPTVQGNGYIQYYAAPEAVATAPDVKIHFAMADVNGYFDLERGDTNDDWKYLLANACSKIIDLRTPRMQVAFTTEHFRQQCPENAVELAQILESVVRREREIMGLIRYNEEPKNRQFARITGGGMFADGIGAGASDPTSWMIPDAARFGWWGLAHELGHVNQVRPSFKWTGLGEVTNNVYSAWVEFAESKSADRRLESENLGVFNSNAEELYRGPGGRFNCYLQQNVCEDAMWQFANGDDYHGQQATDYTVPDEDEDGNVIPGKEFTGPRRNFDHFVKLPPLWQLQLYGTQAGFAPDLYAKVLKGLREASDLNENNEEMTNGQQQIRFIRTVCDSTKLNFLPFFEKAGMFQPIKRIIEDYTPGLLNISQKMIDELKQYVAEAGYPLPEGEVNYISGLNWKMYKDRAAMVTGQVGEGCTSHGTYVTVQNSVWQNAVAFETYDAEGKMIAISMYGLGHSADINNITATDVIYPAGAVEIKAVSWDGQRVTCYKP